MVVLVNLHVILYYYPYCGWMESCVSLSFSLTTTLALPISPLVSEYALYFDFVAILMWRTAMILSVVIDLAFIQRRIVQINVLSTSDKFSVATEAKITFWPSTWNCGNYERSCSSTVLHVFEVS